jgi:hypothetical protein
MVLIKLINKVAYALFWQNSKGKDAQYFSISPDKSASPLV